MYFEHILDKEAFGKDLDRIWEGIGKVLRRF